MGKGKIRVLETNKMKMAFTREIEMYYCILKERVQEICNFIYTF